MDLQPVLESTLIRLQPLQSSDFDRLYTVASDPAVWQQHPNPLRYQQDVFRNYFEGAIESKGALLLIDKIANNVMGATRFYEYNATDKSVLIGYTFFGTKYWGGAWNPIAKKMMLEFAFAFVDKVIFHIGGSNVRSQIAIERLGAIKVAELEVAYYGEESKLNYVYKIEKATWASV